MNENTAIHKFALMMYRSPSFRFASALHGNIKGTNTAGAAHAPQYARYPQRPKDSYADVAITTTTLAIQHALYFKQNVSAHAFDGFVRASTNQRADVVDVAFFFDFNDAADDAGAFNLVIRRVFTGVSVAYDAARHIKMQTKMPVMSVTMSPVSGDMFGTDVAA